MRISDSEVSAYLAIFAALCAMALPGCGHHEDAHHEEAHKVVVTNPMSKDVVITQQFVCQIHSSRHIEICALQDGYLEEIPVKEGQAVKKGDTMFKILPTLFQARLDAEVAEVRLAQIEYDNTKRLFEKNVVAQPEVALADAKLAKAQAQANLARAELNFATIKAPFDGIIDQQMQQQGSLIAEGDKLTTLSDNSLMWVYFNVPEADYLAYKTSKDKDNLKIELRLANGKTFGVPGKIGAIEADFNNETGNIAFRADFPNPDRLLRHGQTGTVLLSRVAKDSIVIPQRATYETLAKKYVYVVEPIEGKPTGEHADQHADKHKQAEKDDDDNGDDDKDDDDDDDDDKDDADEHAEHPAKHHAEKHDGKHGIARQREIVINSEQDDIYLIESGIGVSDKIVLEGVRQVRDGDEVEYEYLAPEDALKDLKFHAE